MYMYVVSTLGDIVYSINGQSARGCSTEDITNTIEERFVHYSTCMIRLHVQCTAGIKKIWNLDEYSGCCTVWFH